MQQKKRWLALVLACAMLLSIMPLGALAQAPAGEPVTTDINIAKSRPVTASGAYSGMPASNVTDGNAGSRWTSPSGNTPEVYASSLYVDLGEEPVRYNKIELAFEYAPHEYRIEVSDDAKTWREVKSVLHEDSATLPKGKTESFVFETPLTARYVKFQGVEPRHNGDGSINVWGYSIYEFRVYQAPVSDQESVAQAKAETSLLERTKRDFPLPQSHDNGTQITWTSDSEWITVKGSVAVVKRDTADQVVTLTATFTKGQVTDTRTYSVLIPALQQVDGAYELYPVVHYATYADTALSMTKEVNLVLEDGLDKATQAKAKKVLEKDGITVTVSEAPVTGKTNVLVGIDNGTGADNAWFAGKYDPSRSTKKQDGYVLAVDGSTDTIAIMGRDSDAAFFGVTTLDQILSQTQADSIRDVVIEDYAEVEFRGFIEGFYGTPWSHANRMSLMEFGGDYKMNSYLYGPKNDPYHASKWRELYPTDKLAELQELVEKGHETKVQFVWAAHLGGKINLASEEDFQAVCKKFDQMYGIGVRQFALFFDDASTNNTDLVKFVNRLDKEYIKPKKDIKPIIFCPQFYRKDSGSQATINYLKQISQFPADVQIMWTGDHVVSGIKQSTVDWVTQFINRPVYIWWNYPVNDLGRSSYVHMGPSQGLYPGVTKISGFTSNPMNQAQASKISLFSIADYTWNTEDYDSQKSWEASFSHVIRDNAEAAKALAIFSAHSSAGLNPFGVRESVYMQEHLDAFMNALMSGEDLTATAAVLDADFAEILAAVDTLQAYTGTGNISGEISRWTSKLEKVAAALRTLVADAAKTEAPDANNPNSIQAFMDLIKRNRTAFQQAKSASGTVASQVLIPFGDQVLTALEAHLMAAVHMQPAPQGFGSVFALDYTKIVDGDLASMTSTDSAAVDAFSPVGIGDYFGVNLGRMTHIENLSIYMQSNACFKEGVVEYSTDNKNWKPLGTFKTSTVQMDNLNVDAQFIRYRAIDEFVDANTGSVNGKLGIQEFSVNVPDSAIFYTNVQNLTADVIYESGRVAVENLQNVTLQPGEYIGFQFNTLKNAHSLIIDEALRNLVAEYSQDGVNWKTMDWASSDCMAATYVRVRNGGSEARTFNLGKLEARLGGYHPKMTAEAKNVSVWSGSANNLVDGNRGSTFWLKPSADRTFILDLGKEVPVYDVVIHCVKDAITAGQIRLSTDKQNWSDPITFKGAGLNNLVPCGATTARYIEIKDSIPSAWIQIAEIEVNTTVPEDMPRVSGNVSDVDRLVNRNLFSSVSVGAEAGEVVWNNAGDNISNFVIVKNSGSAVTLWAQTPNGEWKQVKTISDCFADIALGENASAPAFKLTWEANSGLVLHEIATYLGENTPAEPVDKTVLEQTIAKAEAMIPNQEQYVPGNWQQLLDALDAAKKMMANEEATEEEVKAAADTLSGAIAAQQLKADKTGLKDLVAEAEGMDLTGYTAESVESFKTALEAAKAVMANENLGKNDQTVVDEAVAQLNAAIKGLTAEPTPDPEPNPEPNPEPDPEPNPEPDPEPDPEPNPEPDPEPDPEPNPEPNPNPDVKPNPTPAPDAKPEPPKTGDNSSVMMWATVAMASLAGVACAAVALTNSHKRKID